MNYLEARLYSFLDSTTVSGLTIFTALDFGHNALHHESHVGVVRFCDNLVNDRLNLFLAQLLWEISGEDSDFLVGGVNVLLDCPLSCLIFCVCLRNLFNTVLELLDLCSNDLENVFIRDLLVGLNEGLALLRVVIALLTRLSDI